jgi:hypothetical protein
VKSKRGRALNEVALPPSMDADVEVSLDRITGVF